MNLNWTNLLISIWGLIIVLHLSLLISYLKLISEDLNELIKQNKN